MNISIIVAIARNHGIGFENKLLTFESGQAFDDYRKKLTDGEILPEDKTAEDKNQMEVTQ